MNNNKVNNLAEVTYYWNKIMIRLNHRTKKSLNKQQMNQ